MSTSLTLLLIGYFAGIFTIVGVACASATFGMVLGRAIRGEASTTARTPMTTPALVLAPSQTLPHGDEEQIIAGFLGMRLTRQEAQAAIARITHVNGTLEERLYAALRTMPQRTARAA